MDKIVKAVKLEWRGRCWRRVGVVGQRRRLSFGIIERENDLRIQRWPG